MKRFQRRRKRERHLKKSLSGEKLSFLLK